VYILIFMIGFMIGIILNGVIERISHKIMKSDRKTINILIPIITGLCFEILYMRLGYTIILAKAMTMTAFLIIISFIDIRHRIISDYMVLLALIIGIMFSIVVKMELIDIIMGMVVGGGILFLLALVPNAMGGGDIKLMFAMGAFLGLNRTLWALLLAFMISSVVSIALIIFKIKGTKDTIPFGPFLSLGSFISLLVFI